MLRYSKRNRDLTSFSISPSKILSQNVRMRQSAQLEGGVEAISTRDPREAQSIPTANGEGVIDAYQRLVLNAQTLLPSCEMPLSRALFAEWFAEQEAQKEQA